MLLLSSHLDTFILSFSLPVSFPWGKTSVHHFQAWFHLRLIKLSLTQNDICHQASIELCQWREKKMCRLQKNPSLLTRFTSSSIFLLLIMNSFSSVNITCFIPPYWCFDSLCFNHYFKNLPCFVIILTHFVPLRPIKSCGIWVNVTQTNQIMSVPLLSHTHYCIVWSNFFLQDVQVIF